MKFVCTRRMALDGSEIYPGTYNVRQDDIFGFIVENVAGCNWLAYREELEKCGYFIE